MSGFHSKHKRAATGTTSMLWPGLNRTFPISPRAAVVVPPLCDFYATPHRFSTLGARIVAQILNDSGIESESFAFPLDKASGTPIPLPQSLSYLKNFMMPNETGGASFFTQYKHFGPTAAECAQRVAEGKPDICFVSCFAFCYAPPTLSFIRELSLLLPRTLIVLGGAGPSAYPDFFLRNCPCDLVLTGEAEVSLPPLLSALKQTGPAPLPNAHWLDDNGNACCTESEFAKSGILEFILAETYQTRKTVYLTTSLSRGCPKSCTFCSNHITHGKELRTVPLEHIEQGLKDFKLSEDLNGREIAINFEDDNLAAVPDYLLGALDLFTARFPEARFYAENGMDYQLLSEDLCEKLTAKGMAQFNFTLGSSDPLILRATNRSGSKEHFWRLLEILTRRSIQSVTYIICGFPEDTPDSIAANLSFLAAAPTRIGISLYYPVPGIAGFEMRALFDTVDPVRCTGSAAWPWNNSVSTNTLVTAFRLARLINMIKENRYAGFEREIIDRTIETRALYTAVRCKGGTISVVELPEQDRELVALFLGKMAAGWTSDTQTDNCLMSTNHVLKQRNSLVS